MAFNLPKTVSILLILFNNDRVSKAALSPCESEEGIAKAMSGIVPSVFAEL